MPFPFALLIVAASFQAPAHDPQARALLDQVASAYKSLPAYSDEGTLTRTIRKGDETIDRTAEVPLAFARPNRLSLAVEGVRLTCDGKNLTTTSDSLKRYLTRPAPAGLELADILVSPLGSILDGAPIESPSLTLLTLLLDDNAVPRILEDVASLHLEPQPVDAGLTALRIEAPARPSTRIIIDPQTKLIRRIERAISAESLTEASPASASLASYTLTWNSGPISTDPPPAETTTFTPPDGFKPVVIAQAKPPAAEEAHPLVGKPAPDFELTLLNGPDHTEKVTRTALAGKVVILDFWATWCGPCREELPEIQSLVERLARTHAGKVVVIALSQDREPDDGSSVRDLVEGTLKELEVDLASKAPTARVGLDPTQTVGDAFGVQGIPTLVVLDQNGQVQAVHVGYKEGIADVLQEEVETLLTGGSLLQPKQARAGR
jgi:thiol-disulfide isomerase/thioredoxin